MDPQHLPEEVRLRLALAVAVPEKGALLIDEDNNNAGWLPIDETVRRDVPFAVEVQPDILAVDFDDPVRAADDATELSLRLGSVGIPAVILESGQEGHRHLFARVEAHRFARYAELGRNLGGKVRRTNNRIRPPGTKHRLGGRSQLIQPVSADEALHLLGTHSTAASLSPRMRALLRHGDLNGTYTSRSEVIQALALAAVNAGLSEEWLIDALLDPNNRGGAKVQEMNPRKARKYVQRSYEKAVRYAKAKPPIESASAARAEIQAIRTDASEARWPGTAGATDRVVLDALLVIALEAGTIKPTASVRQLAERAGVDKDTVSRSLRRLVDAGYITRLKKGQGTRASQWHIKGRPPHGTGTLETTPRGRENNNVPIVSADHDAFRRGALGKISWAILSQTDRLSGLTVGDIAEAFGHHPATIRRNLKRLAEHGLASGCEDGRCSMHSTAEGLHEAAQTAGTAGRGDLQKARHMCERRAYQEYLDRRARSIVDAHWPGALQEPA